MQILQDYQDCSCQLINKDKSYFLTSSKCSSSRRAVVAKLTGFSYKSFLVKYLGCPLFLGRKVRSLFSRLIDSIAGRISSWSSKWLSFGGRLVIKSVMLSMLVYLLSVLDPPKEVINHIHQLLGNFLWGSMEGEQRHDWLSWSKLCQKFEEGVGLCGRSTLLLRRSHVSCCGDFNEDVFGQISC